MRTKSALSYFGSDSEVAAQLAAMLDDCKHVTIPFCGGLAILPHLKARAIVANDLNELAINFYRVASGWHDEWQQKQLLKMCRHTLSHPADIEWAESWLADNRPLPFQKAWAYWALCWIARKGKGGTKKHGGMPSVRRTAVGGTNASRIRAAASDLEEWAQHFERCEWECIDFRKLLPKVANNLYCGIYCDPPWVGAGEAYLHSFTEADHADLRNQLNRFTHTTVVVRYGDDPLVRELYSDWRIVERSSRDQCNAVKGELWITNKGAV